jgi:hypothetical protein
MRPDPSEVGGHLELKNLVAGLVLGACDEDERLRAREHLTACPRCTDLTRRLAETVEVVPLAVEGVRPPANLRGRILYADWPAHKPLALPYPAQESGSG